LKPKDTRKFVKTKFGVCYRCHGYRPLKVIDPHRQYYAHGKMRYRWVCDTCRETMELEERLLDRVR
jgi:hypothetical protein